MCVKVCITYIQPCFWSLSFIKSATLVYFMLEKTQKPEIFLINRNFSKDIVGN